jgi:hypothetical protein
MNHKVIVRGVGGLGNCLFQLATAIYYSKKYGHQIYLDNSSDALNYGTANYTNRQQNKCIVGQNVSYRHTIFRKLFFDDCNEDGTVIHNEYSDTKLDGSDPIIIVSGYCQNKDLFDDVRHSIIDYLLVNEPHTVHYLHNKYGCFDGHRKNIMVGIRICEDFKHMSKINGGSIQSALQCITNDSMDYNLIVICDDPKNYRDKINFYVRGNIIVVDEDDIIQFNAGFLCDAFILSESTYHYWIAYLKHSVNPTTQVVCFNDTDITNRNLALDEWIRIDY